MADTGDAIDNAEISAQTSKRICAHMNDDHAVTVFAMAKTVASIKSGWKLSEAKLLKVSLSGCSLRAVTCSGTMCEMQTVDYPFEPHVTSSSEVRPRLIAVHNSLLLPKFSWLVTKPPAVIIVLILLALSYGEFVLGADGMKELIDGVKVRHHLSTETIVQTLRFVFWGSLVAHALEGLYGFYQSRTTLKLSLEGQLKWAAILTIAGMPVMQEFTPLIEAAATSKKSQ